MGMTHMSAMPSLLNRTLLYRPTVPKLHISHTVYFCFICLRRVLTPESESKEIMMLTCWLIFLYTQKMYIYIFCDDPSSMVMKHIRGWIFHSLTINFIVQNDIIAHKLWTVMTLTKAYVSVFSPEKKEKEIHICPYHMPRYQYICDKPNDIYQSGSITNRTTFVWYTVKFCLFIPSREPRTGVAQRHLSQLFC